MEKINPTQIMTTIPTYQQIINYMLAKLAECESIRRGHNCFRIEVQNYGGKPQVTFQAYEQSLGHAPREDTGDGALESFRILAGKYSPQEEANSKRKAAAELLAEAEKLESQNQNQP